MNNSSEKLQEDKFSCSSDVLSYTEYKKLHELSVTSEFEYYWTSLLSSIHWERKWTRFCDDSEPLKKFFLDGKINPVHSVLDLNAAKFKDINYIEVYDFKREAIIFSMTYGELIRQTKNLAAYLRSQGIKKGDVVGIFSPNMPQSPVFIFACHRIGAITHGIFENFSSQEIRKRLDKIKVKALIAASGRFGTNYEEIPMLDKLSEALGDTSDIKVFVFNTAGLEYKNLMEKHWISINSYMLEDQKNSDEYEILDANDPLTILQTSGSTSEPKCVYHTVVGVLANSLQGKNMSSINFAPGERALSSINPSWISGHIGATYSSAFSGYTMIIMQGNPFVPDISRFWKMIEDQKINAAFFPPAYIKLMKMLDPNGNKRKQFQLEHFKLFISGGDLFDASSESWFRSILPSKTLFINGYGSTESSIMITSQKYADKVKPGSSNRIGMGINLVVRDENIYIGSPFPPTFASGFWKEDLINQKAYVQDYFFNEEGKDYFKVGDSGKIDEDGYLFIGGRSGDILKVGKIAVKLGASEIEALINKNDKVIESIAVEYSTETYNKIILVLQTSPTASKDELDLLLIKLKISIEKEYLNDEGIIDRVVYLKDLPKNSNGKILRPLVKKIVNNQPYVIPANILSTNPILELQAALKN